MATGELGRIQDVELRDVWPNEAQDFTPWLAEHLDLLGGAIGLDLERVDTEVPVGGFVLDILASSEAVGQVAIENQLTVADHGHLGQLATYAAGVGASALVWVAASFRQEHLAALDWLNEWTDSRLGFFAVEVRTIKIGGSLPAADFRAIAAPKDWARKRGAAPSATGMTSSERDRRIAFFNRLVAGANERKLRTSVSAGSVAKSKSFPCGGKEDGLMYWVDLRTTGVLAVQLNIRTGDLDLNKAIISALDEDKIEIERELGFLPKLLAPDPDGPRGRIKGAVAMFRDASIDDPPDSVQEALEWCLSVLEAFQRRLEPRLMEIIQRLKAEEADGVGEGGLGDNFE